MTAKPHTAQQADLYGDIIVSTICKRTRTGGAYYLRLSETDIADYYIRRTLKDGTVMFSPMNLGGPLDETSK
ncbi:hypothetical protein ES708_14350 [subsurface metagenome]